MCPDISVPSVPKCLESGHFGTSAYMSYEQFGTGAEVSWVRSVSGLKCLYTDRPARSVSSVVVTGVILKDDDMTGQTMGQHRHHRA